MTDRDVVMRWVCGWAHVHQLTVDEVDDWPLVHVGRPSCETEIVCVDPGRAAFDRLARHTAHDPREMLTVIGRGLVAYTSTPLPPGLRVDRDDETFMTTTLVPSPVEVPAGLTARWDEDGPRATYRLDDGERVAAEGSVGVRGTDAVIDAVETSSSHRRRGLARHVMGVLTIWAVNHGATTGLLAASADGAALYTSLGWNSTLDMWSLMGTADD